MRPLLITSTIAVALAVIAAFAKPIPVSGTEPAFAAYRMRGVIAPQLPDLGVGHRVPRARLLIAERSRLGDAVWR